MAMDGSFVFEIVMRELIAFSPTQNRLEAIDGSFVYDRIGLRPFMAASRITTVV
jgi:hypothetical protein